MTVKIIREVNGNNVAVVTLDAVIAEQIKFSSSVTEHKLEDGSTIADHKVINPTDITVTGFVSNYPVRIFGAGIFPVRDDNRASAAYEALKNLVKGTERVTIIDRLEHHSSMLLTELSIPLDTMNYHGLRFEAIFRQVRLVQTRQVEISASDAPIAQPAEDRGVVTPQEPTPEAEASRDSWLVQILGL